MTTLADLEKGDKFRETTFTLTDEWVDDYVNAVEDKAIGDLGGGLVPPTAVAALPIRKMLEQVSLPELTVHDRQELTFVAPVRRRDVLTIAGEIVSKRTSTSRPETIVRVSQTVTRDHNVVLIGEARVVFPFTRELPEPRLSTMGMTLRAVAKEITPARINEYANASGDHNRLHVDPSYARKTVFGGPIAHGMLVLAHVSEMLTVNFGEAWPAGGWLLVRFRSPARPDDTLTASGTAKSADADKTLCEVECHNQRGEIVLDGRAKVSR